MSETKYTVRLLFDVHGWAYHRRCKALEIYKPDDFTVTIGGVYGKEFKQRHYDLVLQLCYPCAKRVRQHITNGKYDMSLVTGFNVAWSEGGSYWREAYKYSDWVVLNSRAAWEDGKRPEHSSYISNGVDRETFAVKVPPADRRPKVLCIGSKFHKKNKGFDNVLVEVEAKLKPHGIPCDFRCVDSHGKKRLNAQEMCDWYNEGTVYVVASRREGTPNPALEAASCGNIIVATRVGNMPELIEDGVNGYLVEREANAIVQRILDAHERRAEMATAMEAAITPWHWKIRGEQYFDLFRRLIEEKRHGVRRVREKEAAASPA